jgi:tetratricopeptide (TPR) repeat protein
MRLSHTRVALALLAALIGGCGYPAKRSTTTRPKASAEQRSVPPAAKTHKEPVEAPAAPAGATVEELRSMLNAATRQRADAERAAEISRKALDEQRASLAQATKELADCRSRLAKLEAEQQQAASAAHQTRKDDQTYRALLAVARSLCEQNNYTSARSLLEGMADLGCEDGLLFYLLGQCCQEVGDPDAALKNYAKACDAWQSANPKPPQYAYALNNLGVVLRSLRRFSDAEEAYQRAIKASPSYANAYYNLGVLYEEYLKDRPKALQAFEKYIDLRGERCAEAQERVRRLRGTGK